MSEKKSTGGREREGREKKRRERDREKGERQREGEHEGETERREREITNKQTKQSKTKPNIAAAQVTCKPRILYRMCPV